MSKAASINELQHAIVSSANFVRGFDCGEVDLFAEVLYDASCEYLAEVLEAVIT